MCINLQIKIWLDGMKWKLRWMNDVTNRKNLCDK